ncbi:hypothetical protein H6G64_20905 [Calothrix sp. FACHB-156]|nr:hypothetical protein [Calothrix sp. FACHB-156]
MHNPGLSTVNRQPSTVNRQPSTVNRQPSTVNSQPSTVNRQQPKNVYLLVKFTEIHLPVLLYLPHKFLNLCC